jgi:hypothetical protein
VVPIAISVEAFEGEGSSEVIVRLFVGRDADEAIDELAPHRREGRRNLSQLLFRRINNGSACAPDIGRAFRDTSGDANGLYRMVQDVSTVLVGKLAALRRGQSPTAARGRHPSCSGPPTGC